VSGIADAIARNSSGDVETVIDWKSDIEMSPSKLAAYQTQLGEYRNQTGAKQALLVLMSAGRILNA
jgi:exodeoxyribonuclease-5